MKLKRNYLIMILSLFTAVFMFTAGDCGSDPDPDEVPTSIAAPANAKVVVDQPASSSTARISWDLSADDAKSFFQGYSVVTFRVDSAGNVISRFDSSMVGKGGNTYTTPTLTPMQRYRTQITAVGTNNLRSDSLSTIIYGAVFKNTATIDEYMQQGTAQSGYGWDTEYGIGTQYAYTQENAAEIDLHLRDSNGLKFVSPDQYAPGVKITKIDLIGQGQAAFDQTNLDEPNSNSETVVENGVYLLKTQSNNYIKVWVKEIINPDGNSTVNFEFKVQPISGLRVVKTAPTAGR